MHRMLEFVLRRRLVVVGLALCVMVAGYLSYRRLPVDAFPDVSPNLVQVFTTTEGLAPEEVEKYVTYPVESVMAGLPGVEKVRSVSNFGLSVVNIYFEDGMDVYFCRQVVNERLQEARGTIPQGFGDPTMGPISTGMGLILFYYLNDESGRYSVDELRTLQDWLVKFKLQTVQGVTEVLGIGGHEKQFHVNVDASSLLRYDLDLKDIKHRIEANNLNVGAQFIEKNAEELIVRSIGLAKGIEDLENIVVKTEDGRVVYVKDVAQVVVGGSIRRGLQTRNGEGEVVAGMVVKLYGTNASTVIEKVEDRITEINDLLPDGVQIVPYYQQKEIVQAAVDTVLGALFQGIVLVVLVLLVFMGGVRPSLVVAAVIPFSVMFTMIAMDVLGFSANLMSLGGLAIAIGLLVDGTIVLVENMDRLIRVAEPGEARIRVIARASRAVLRPITFAVIIIIVVFLPLFTLQGVEGKTFRPLAYTVALAMLGSLLFAILVAPALGALLMRPPRLSQTVRQHKEPIVIRGLQRLYRPLVKTIVARRWLAVTFSLVIVAAGLWVFPRLGSEFTPRLREGTIVVRLTMAPSIALTESKRLTLIAERRLMKIPEVREVVTRIGRGEVGAHADPVNSAELFVLLKSKTEWRTPGDQDAIEEMIRNELGYLPGVLVNLTQPIEMTIDELLEGIRAELAIKLFGEDLDILKDRAGEIAAILKGVRGAADVQVDQISGVPQLLISPDRDAIARFGLNLADVQDVIDIAVGGTGCGRIFEGIRQFEIVVRYEQGARNDIDAIGNILVRAPKGSRIPLDQLASIEEVVGPRQITREDSQRFISVQCNVVRRDIGSFVADAQARIEAQLDLPPGYATTWGGEFRLQQEANKRLAVVVPVTLALIAFLLYGSFNSIKNTMLILLNIPLALVGGVIALWVTGQNLSVPSSVGFIALFGIALENGMVLVTYFNQLVSQGVSVDEASVRGACLRLRPVLMTALTTGLGLIPLLLATGTGSDVQRPLATVVMGGLSTSTLLTLVVIPGLYAWFSPNPQPRIDGREPHAGSGERGGSG